MDGTTLVKDHHGRRAPDRAGTCHGPCVESRGFVANFTGRPKPADRISEVSSHAVHDRPRLSSGTQAGGP